MVAGLKMLTRGLGLMDPQDETAKNTPEAIVQGLQNDRADPAGSEPKLSWEKGDRIEAQGLSYTIEQSLAAGGFGNTYKAKDNKNDKSVVLKMPTPKLWTVWKAEECQRIFREEGDRLSGFQYSKNPHLVKYKTRFELRSGVPILVMEYVTGKSLIHLPNSISEEKALGYIHQIASAVQVLHNAGLYHRDIKPENLILKTVDGTETLVLVDLGISREAGQLHTASGSPLWAPPEQTNEYAPSEPDYSQDVYAAIAKSHDVYAIAKVLYWLITGKYFHLEESQPSTRIMSEKTYQAIVLVTETKSETRTITNKKGKREKITLSVLKNRLTLDEFLRMLPVPASQVVTPVVTQPSNFSPSSLPVLQPEPITLTVSPTIPPSVSLTPSGEEPNKNPLVISSEPLPGTIQPVVGSPVIVYPESPKSGFLAGVLKTIAVTIVFTPLLAIPIVLVWAKSTIDPPVPLEISAYKDFNQIPFHLSYNPDLWQDQTQPLDRFRDNIVTHLVHRGNQPIDLSIEHFETLSLEFKPPKAAIGIEEETITFLNQSVNTVTYQVTDKDSDRSVQVQQITLPLDQNVYHLFYEAPPDLFSRYEDEALKVFSSFDRSPPPLSPTSP